MGEIALTGKAICRLATEARHPTVWAAVAIAVWMNVFVYAGEKPADWIGVL